MAGHPVASELILNTGTEAFIFPNSDYGWIPIIRSGRASGLSSATPMPITRLAILQLFSPSPRDD